MSKFTQNVKYGSSPFSTQHSWRAYPNQPHRLILISGPRQVGKTTLVRDALTHYGRDRYHFVQVDRPDETYFPGAIPMERDTFNQDAQPRDGEWLVRQWQRARAAAQQSVNGHILVLDEIQKIPRWSDTVKGLWDTDRAEDLKLHVVLLGSSPLLMNKGMSESLAGRYELIRLTHWSFPEMYEAFDFVLEDYIYFGGYPGSAAYIRDEHRWRDYVRASLIEPNIEKDILAMTRVDKPALLKQLFRLSCEYSGQLLSYTKMLGQLQDAGKTTAFKQEAAESGGEYVKARDFITFEPQAENQNKVLFIDGLDEMRGDHIDSRTPLDQIRRHLDKLGRPHFRLSCRQADWLGASDRDALTRVSPKETLVALHLDPLTDDDIIEILKHKESVPNPHQFVHKANEHQLGELLRNPQTLNLLVEAVGNDKWPGGRRETYEKACNQLIPELNPEHRAAKRSRPIPDSSLINAAGYLCAVQLLSGRAGYALDDIAINTQYAGLRELDNPANLPLKQALESNLFQGDGENCRSPIHRTVAEYLGACYLAELVQKRGLPIGRVVALITGEDGGVVADLRGLSAWLAVHCQSGRDILIERDPLGVVLYGDVKQFPVSDKKRILEAMANEAQRYPWFRSDDWSSPPFGALGTTDIADTFNEILALPSREEADQQIVGCVLDAIRYGERLATLADRLSAIVNDTTYRPRIRTLALEALIHVTPHDDPHLMKLAEEIRAGTVEDRDDELLGILLCELYPHIIPPVQVFDYLHTRKEEGLIGNYFEFWIDRLPSTTNRDTFPVLLDQLVYRRKNLINILAEHPFAQMIGKLLVTGLEAHGDTITDERLYDWLGLENEDHQRIAQWLTDRPHRYKAMLNQGAIRCADQEDIRICDCIARRYRATAPPGITTV